MSAYIVSDETMHKAVQAMGGSLPSLEEKNKLGRKLFALNEKAVNYRYKEQTTETGIDYRYKPVQCTKVEMFKALKCLIYQCSEGEEIEKMELYQRLVRIKDTLACEIVMDLPAYDKAPWNNN